MNQRTHAWIAIRAIKLLQDSEGCERLAKLLKPYARKAAIGAWIPDKRDAKLGGSRTQNHILKMGPYNGPFKGRFVVDRDGLLGRLGEERRLYGFLDSKRIELDDNWWDQPYKADPAPGQHLANRAMSLTINNIDMLILGDPSTQSLVPGRIDFIKEVDLATRVSTGQAVLFFFMLSHFIADSLMPCHCDERGLSDYSKGLHNKLEEHWGRVVGSDFDDENLNQPGLSATKILNRSADIDSRFGINFSNHVPEMKSKDVWEEVINLCRASFAVACVIAPPDQYPYKPNDEPLAPYSTVFKQSPEGEALLREIDAVIMHDAVLNVAIIWKTIWDKFC